MQPKNAIVRRAQWLLLSIVTISSIWTIVPNRFTLAEISPAAYQRLRNNAPEALKIRVLDVKTKASKRDILTIEASAQVLSVQRSPTKLQNGSKIKIVYQVDRRVSKRPGSSKIPMLRSGSAYTAFLQFDRGNYQPAAYGLSFDLNPQ